MNFQLAVPSKKTKLPLQRSFEWCGILHCVNHDVRCFLHDIEYLLLL